MKRIFLLLVAAVVVMSSFARVENQLTNRSIETAMKSIQHNREGVSLKAPNLNEAPVIITDQPQGEFRSFERNTYSVFYGYNGWTASYTQGEINVVINGDKAYIQNPIYYYSNYNAWLAGDYDAATGIITIPTGQYVAYFDYDNYGIQVVWGYTSVYEEDGGYFLADVVDESVEAIQFQIVDGDLYLLGSEGNVNAEYPDFYNAKGMVAAYDDDVFVLAVECVMSPGEPIGIGSDTPPAVAGKPANPTIRGWYDCGNEVDGESCLRFTLPTTDVEGNPLVMENVSYRIYTDNDQLFTFDADTYWLDISEDMTEVPYWLWSNGMWFYENIVYFYRTNEGDNPMFTWRIGIQVGYTAEGMTNYSDIVYLEVFPGPATLRGDVNGDEDVNIADVTDLIDYLLSGDASGINLEAADCNLDNDINIADVTDLIDYLLSGNWN
jgi:hypothetical protein